jgi:murein DD-endopeptidase MepM/ murein hydrolase activator NlpD
MAGIYSRTGGEKGAEGVRGYLSDVVGGAIRAGFESNIQQYADMMGSARMQAVQQTGQGMSDRAFGLLQDVMAGLTGGNSRTSALFRDNVQMAGAGLQSFLSYGGTADPYSTSAAYLRLAGVDEAALDSRFNSPEQMMANAQRVLRMTTSRVQGISGMGADEFRAAAASDPNFVQNLIAGNSGLQRQTSATLQGILGRQATAQDLRTFEELANISVANGGRLPTGPGGDGGRVEQLLAQLQESPGDQARKLEAEAHNLTIQAMSNLNEASLKMKETQVELLKQLNGLPLEEIGEGLVAAIDGILKFIREAGPQISSLAREGISAFHKLRDMVNEFKESAIGRLIFGGDTSSREIGEQVGGFLSSPGGRSTGMAFLSAMPGPLGSIATAANIVRAVEENPEAVSVDTAQQGGRSVGRAALRVLRGAGNYVGGLIDGAFNDTPGTVTAAPGYNVFGFAPGDIISARMGGISGGASLTDIFQVLRDSNLLDIQAYQTAREQRKLLQDVTNDVLKTNLLIHGNSEINTQRQLPSIIQMMQAFFPRLLTAVDSVRESLISTLTSIMGDRGGGGTMAGTGVDQFPIPGMTLDTATISSGFGFRNIFGRRDFHEGIDIVAKGGTPVLAARGGTVSQIRPLADQLQIAIRSVDERGREIEEWYIHTANSLVEVGDQVQAGQQIAEIASTSERARRARVSTGDHLDYRVRVDGEWVDPRTMLRGLPAGGTQPTPRAGGGSVNLSTGYESLEQLSGQLTSMDPRFNTNTPDGRAALAIALAIGGTEHFGLNQRETNFFTKMGGTGNNMMGFAQFNLGAHNRANIDTPQEYVDYLADMLTGSRPRPDGRAQVDYASRLRSAVQSGQINSGRELEQWLRSAGLGRNNWQALDDGWSRTPGLSDQLLRMLRGGGDNRQASNNRTTNITVNIASATDPARTRQEVFNGVHAAMPYLDEFEQTRRNSSDRNPRNSGNLSPVYG